MVAAPFFGLVLIGCGWLSPWSPGCRVRTRLSRKGSRANREEQRVRSKTGGESHEQKGETRIRTNMMNRRHLERIVSRCIYHFFVGVSHD